MSDAPLAQRLAGGRDPLAGRIPVSIVTGFLGSGKTTLINRLLKKPEMNRIAVIVNEFGEIAIDNDLVEASTEQMKLLDSGCLCCAVRGDLEETLRELFVQRRNGQVIDFERVVIETTGLADPAPVMRNSNASSRVGISGTRIRKMFDGRWVNTIVLTRPKRRASPAAASCENAPRMPAQRKIVAVAAIDR